MTVDATHGTGSAGNLSMIELELVDLREQVLTLVQERDAVKSECAEVRDALKKTEELAAEEYQEQKDSYDIELRRVHQTLFTQATQASLQNDHLMLHLLKADSEIARLNQKVDDLICINKDLENKCSHLQNIIKQKDVNISSENQLIPTPRRFSSRLAGRRKPE